MGPAARSTTRPAVRAWSSTRSTPQRHSPASPQRSSAATSAPGNARSSYTREDFPGSSAIRSPTCWQRESRWSAALAASLARAPEAWSSRTSRVTRGGIRTLEPLARPTDRPFRHQRGGPDVGSPVSSTWNSTKAIDEVPARTPATAICQAVELRNLVPNFVPDSATLTRARPHLPNQIWLI